MQKTVNSISAFLRYSEFKSPETRLTTAIFDHTQLKIFLSTFNFCEFVSTYKKIGCFINLFWRNGWFNSPAIWFAFSQCESILAYISGTKNFPIQNLCRNRKNNIDFQWKLMTNFFKKFKKLYFWPIFLIFGVRKVFFKNYCSVIHNIIRVCSTIPNVTEI